MDESIKAKVIKQLEAAERQVKEKLKLQGYSGAADMEAPVSSQFSEQQEEYTRGHKAH
jgi:hypothetical protein